MEIHIDGIRHDLQAAAAALGDEAVVDALRRLSDTVEPSLRLRVIDLLSEAALTLNGQLADGHIEVRLGRTRAGARVTSTSRRRRTSRRHPATT